MKTLGTEKDHLKILDCLRQDVSFFFNKGNIKINTTNSKITGLVLHMDGGHPEQSALWCKNLRLKIIQKHEIKRPKIESKNNMSNFSTASCRKEGQKIRTSLF